MSGPNYNDPNWQRIRGYAAAYLTEIDVTIADDAKYMAVIDDICTALLMQYVEKVSQIGLSHTAASIARRLRDGEFRLEMEQAVNAALTKVEGLG